MHRAWVTHHHIQPTDPITLQTGDAGINVDKTEKKRLLRIGFFNYGLFTGVFILITLVITGSSVSVWQTTSQFLIIGVSYFSSFFFGLAIEGNPKMVLPG